MQLIFSVKGYDFYRDNEGYWQCVHKGNAAPKRGAYGRADSLARLKGIPLHLVPIHAAKLDENRSGTSRALQERFK